VIAESITLQIHKLYYDKGYTWSFRRHDSGYTEFYMACRQPGPRLASATVLTRISSIFKDTYLFSFF